VALFLHVVCRCGDSSCCWTRYSDKFAHHKGTAKDDDEKDDDDPASMRLFKRDRAHVQYLSRLQAKLDTVESQIALQEAQCRQLYIFGNGSPIDSLWLSYEAVTIKASEAGKWIFLSFWSDLLRSSTERPSFRLRS
jgi:hypothetical protein